ncbi:hypothetical protein DFH27DRAFT_642904 [Peziza echinospora]|nr:hypothetical protein DFH27DRAFT_642904 [Peziza echinospora]
MSPRRGRSNLRSPKHKHQRSNNTSFHPSSSPNASSNSAAGANSSKKRRSSPKAIGTSSPPALQGMPPVLRSRARSQSSRSSASSDSQSQSQSQSQSPQKLPLPPAITLDDDEPKFKPSSSSRYDSDANDDEDLRGVDGAVKKKKRKKKNTKEFTIPQHLLPSPIPLPGDGSVPERRLLRSAASISPSITRDTLAPPTTTASSPNTHLSAAAKGKKQKEQQTQEGPQQQQQQQQQQKPAQKRQRTPPGEDSIDSPSTPIAKRTRSQFSSSAAAAGPTLPTSTSTPVSRALSVSPCVARVRVQVRNRRSRSKNKQKNGGINGDLTDNNNNKSNSNNSNNSNNNNNQNQNQNRNTETVPGSTSVSTSIVSSPAKLPKLLLSDVFTHFEKMDEAGEWYPMSRLWQKEKKKRATGTGGGIVAGQDGGVGPSGTTSSISSITSLGTPADDGDRGGGTVVGLSGEHRPDARVFNPAAFTHSGPAGEPSSDLNKKARAAHPQGDHDHDHDIFPDADGDDVDVTHHPNTIFDRRFLTQLALHSPHPERVLALIDNPDPEGSIDDDLIGYDPNIEIPAGHLDGFRRQCCVEEDPVLGPPWRRMVREEQRRRQGWMLCLTGSLVVVIMVFVGWVWSWDVWREKEEGEGEGRRGGEMAFIDSDPYTMQAPPSKLENRQQTRNIIIVASPDKTLVTTAKSEGEQA